ncbi:hypothetical protein ACFXDJ_13095 [Streptomyces sp. NPDC059443]|uniref:hypothetical protein n=1 Tax=unclassified Streptomyces TaxID=2593676 RepID=UPI0036C28641
MAYRLRELRPPRLAELPSGARPADRQVHPFQTCEDCDRAYRAPSPGRCTSCAEAKAA